MLSVRFRRQCTAIAFEVSELKAPSTMKLRESGMPSRDYWETLFDVPFILNRFGFGASTGNVAELGCGYGTFTVPLAARISGRVLAYDIDEQMVDQTRVRASSEGLSNVSAIVRDVFALGFGLPDQFCDACLLFNILHGESPVSLLREAERIVRPGGNVAVIHWRDDIATPRGPSLDIRPRAEQIIGWAGLAGNLFAAEAPFILPPWHYGVNLVKRDGHP